MRALIVVVAAALSLGACGQSDQADNSINVDERLTAENITANDVTAIDAVTADAANMAADVDINFTNEQMPGGSGNRAAPAAGAGARTRNPSRAPDTPAPRPRPAPAPEPASNAGDNTAG